MEIEIGKIIKTVGLKGEVKIYPYTLDSQQRFNKGIKVNIDDKQFIIDTLRYKDNYPIVSFKDFKDINLIESYLNKVIWIDSVDLPKLNDNSYYGYQLKGFDVEYNNEIIGKLIDFEQYGKQVTARIELNNGKKILIPFINPFLSQIDEINHKIVFIQLEGLL